MRRRGSFLLTLGIVLVGYGAALQGQATVIGEPFSVGNPEAQRHSFVDVALFGADRFAVATDWWQFGEDITDREKWKFGCEVDFIDAAGTLTRRHTLDSGSYLGQYEVTAPTLAADGSGDLVAAWHVLEDRDTRVKALRFFASGTTQELEPALPTTHLWWPKLAANHFGRFAVAWEESVHGSPGWDPAAIGLRVFRADGQPATASVRLSPEHPRDGFHLPVVAIVDGGRSIVLWEESAQQDGRRIKSVRGQRLGRDGQLLGRRFQVGADGADRPSVAALSGGEIVVVWTDHQLAEPRVFVQWVTSTEVRSGPEVAVAIGETSVSMALDRHGNLALLSGVGPVSPDRPLPLRLRLLNRALVPQGYPIDFAASVPPPGNPARGAYAALADSGRMLAATPDRGWLLQARHDADACAFRTDGFACDTAGDGGLPEQVIPFRAGEGGMPFLADWDGDGRADPCIYRGGRFDCDTAHDGGAAEAETPAIGRAGDQPLLGDLDGDGKAAPCVRRGVSFLCDRARDGGAKDLRIDFGRVSDFALLGDPDGDGRDDPCVYRNGRFLCDTAHDGGTAELVLDLRRPVPGRPAGTPLFGDLDGDGRDEACFATKNERTCGFFHPTGGQPLRVERLAFGQAGDVPLMGDVDAF